MGYANKFLKSKGKSSIIKKQTPEGTNRYTNDQLSWLTEEQLSIFNYDTLIYSTSPFYKVSLKRSTKATYDLGVRESMWEGIIEKTSNVKSGDILIIQDSYENGTFLVQTVDSDPSGELAIFLIKTNSVIALQKEIQITDENFNVVTRWEPEEVQFNIPSYIQIVTRTNRMDDVGILDQTIYIAQVPKNINANRFDRIIFENNKYKVESIDSLGLQGIVRLQLSDDIRD